MSDQISIRLEKPQRAALEELAKRSYTKPAGLIRYAIDQMIATANRNGGTLLIPQPKAGK
ncbi:MAG TPA: hypothetical protein VGO11_01095 [Chthoniobacteraceae bacterium]|nr:hypothetical protein [Chthoniobacteraceae bacterium]